MEQPTATKTAVCIIAELTERYTDMSIFLDSHCSETNATAFKTFLTALLTGDVTTIFEVLHQYKDNPLAGVPVLKPAAHVFATIFRTQSCTYQQETGEFWIVVETQPARKREVAIGSSLTFQRSLKINLSIEGIEASTFYDKDGDASHWGAGAGDNKSQHWSAAKALEVFAPIFARELEASVFDGRWGELIAPTVALVRAIDDARNALAERNALVKEEAAAKATKGRLAYAIWRFANREKLARHGL
ncbi:MAG: hypothetical protein KA794_15195 [Candidatus Obscuribacter sp.]|nr:hypothetical protein [Candidatus Obscuribacter sp.]